MRADILVVKTTIAEVDRALAELSTQVQAQIDDVTAVLEDKLTATVDADGATAIHTLKAGVRVNGVFYNAGMSIAVLAETGKPVITRIGFNANQFVLMSGSGDAIFAVRCSQRTGIYQRCVYSERFYHVGENCGCGNHQRQNQRVYSVR